MQNDRFSAVVGMVAVRRGDGGGGGGGGNIETH